MEPGVPSCEGAGIVNFGLRKAPLGSGSPRMNSIGNMGVVLLDVGLLWCSIVVKGMSQELVQIAAHPWGN